MASLQLRNGSYRLLFNFADKQQTYSIGKVPLGEAREWKSRVEQLLRRIDQNLLEIPPGCTINDFIRYDGKPPEGHTPAKRRYTTLDTLWKAYKDAYSKGAIEANTLDTVVIHLNHVTETLSTNFILQALAVANLQSHIDRRTKTVSSKTVRKEIHSFRAVWNWGDAHGYTAGKFPSKGLLFPKTEDKLPFMTWDEIERRLKAGGDADVLWECLYLAPEQTAEFLRFAKKTQVRDYLHPLLVTCAHAGVRRSEAMRAECGDIDLQARVMTVREKKRVKGKLTPRRVPMSGLLVQVLKDQLKQQEGKKYLFGPGDAELTDGQLVKAFTKLVDGSKWNVLKGYHILRHAFISALACEGIDQRLIDEFVGHSTEEQRRRYRHLFPRTTASAIKSVFG